MATPQKNRRCFLMTARRSRFSLRRISSTIARRSRARTTWTRSGRRKITRCLGETTVYLTPKTQITNSGPDATRIRSTQKQNLAAQKRPLQPNQNWSLNRSLGNAVSRTYWRKHWVSAGLIAFEYLCEVLVLISRDTDGDQSSENRRYTECRFVLAEGS